MINNNYSLYNVDVYVSRPKCNTRKELNGSGGSGGIRSAPGDLGGMSKVVGVVEVTLDLSVCVDYYVVLRTYDRVLEFYQRLTA